MELRLNTNVENQKTTENNSVLTQH